MLKNLFKLPEAAAIATLDDPAAVAVHARIIRGKPFLRRIYLGIYEDFQRRLAAEALGPGARVVELGSGAGFLKEVLPYAVTSDVLPVSGLDLCFSALALPFADASLDALLMIDVLHHLSDVHRFLDEARRTLKPGGVVLMVEPANTLWGRFIYRHFHHEPFLPQAPWELPGGGAMTGANGALPWIVFRRDRARFEADFADLELVRMRAFMPVRYLISGGVSRRPLMPSAAYPLVQAAEALLTPLNSLLGMFYQITLRRRAAPRA